MMLVVTISWKVKMANCTVWKPETARKSSPNLLMIRAKGNTKGGGSKRYHQEIERSVTARRAQLGPPHVFVFGARIGALSTDQHDHCTASIHREFDETDLSMAREGSSRTGHGGGHCGTLVRVINETHGPSIRPALCSVGLRHMCGRLDGTCDDP